MKNERNYATTKEIDVVISTVKVLSFAARCFSDYCDLMCAALDEVRAHREAVSRGVHRLDFSEVSKELADRRQELEDVLQRVNVKRFELGKLWLEAHQASDWVHLNFAKESIKEVLKDRYGVDFKLRLFRVKDEEFDTEGEGIALMDLE